MNNIISIQNLTKHYPSFTLGPIRLDIPGGAIIGLIGENGAGKTTFLKCLLGIISSNTGEISILGQDTGKARSALKEDIGVVLDNAFFPELLTPSDIARSMKHFYKNWDDALFGNYLRDFGLSAKSQIKTFSKGMRKKLEIATALSHHPKLLILDEPTSGLDPVVRDDVMEIFQNFVSDEEHTILFSTHITSDLEHIADYIVFVNKGQIALEKSRDDILDNYGILRCDEMQFSKMDAGDIITYRKNAYSYDVLTDSRRTMERKYPDIVLDKITLEELMVMMIKGEKKC